MEDEEMAQSANCLLGKSEDLNSVPQKPWKAWHGCTSVIPTCSKMATASQVLPQTDTGTLGERERQHVSLA